MQAILSILKPILQLIIPFLVELLKQRDRLKLEVVEVEDDPKENKFWKSEKI